MQKSKIGIKFITSLFLILSPSVFGGVVPLSEKDVQSQVSDLGNLYPFARSFLCAWEGGHKVNGDPKWFEKYIGESCKKFVLEECRSWVHNSVKVEQNGQRFEL